MAKYPPGTAQLIYKAATASGDTTVWTPVSGGTLYIGSMILTTDDTTCVVTLKLGTTSYQVVRFATEKTLPFVFDPPFRGAKDEALKVNLSKTANVYVTVTGWQD